MFVNVPIIKLAVAKSNFLIVPEPDGPVIVFSTEILPVLFFKTNNPLGILKLTTSATVPKFVVTV